MALLCRVRRAVWRSSGCSVIFLLDDQLGSALGKLLDNIVLVVLLGQHQLWWRVWVSDGVGGRVGVSCDK